MVGVWLQGEESAPPHGQSSAGSEGAWLVKALTFSHRRVRLMLAVVCCSLLQFAVVCCSLSSFKAPNVKDKASVLQASVVHLRSFKLALLQRHLLPFQA